MNNLETKSKEIDLIKFICLLIVLLISLGIWLKLEYYENDIYGGNPFMIIVMSINVPNLLMLDTKKIILKIFILVLPHFLQLVLNIFIDIKIHLKQTLKFTL